MLDTMHVFTYCSKQEESDVLILLMRVLGLDN